MAWITFFGRGGPQGLAVVRNGVGLSVEQILNSRPETLQLLVRCAEPCVDPSLRSAPETAGRGINDVRMGFVAR